MAKNGRNATKKRLLAMLNSLTRPSGRYSDAAERPNDELDLVQQANDRELELAAIERDVAVANRVRLALQRLERGEYGKCVLCERKIGARRLNALPWATTCLTCQGQVEAERQETGARDTTGLGIRGANGTSIRDEWE